MIDEQELRDDVLYNLATLGLCILAIACLSSASWITEWGWPFWVRVIVDVIGLILLIAAIVRLYRHAKRRIARSK